MLESSTDAFSFDLKLRHSTQEPDVISSALGIEPIYAWAAGQAHAGVIHDMTVWCGTAERVAGQETFGDALRKVAAFLRQHRAFLESFVATGGEVEVAVRFQASPVLLTSAAGDGIGSRVFDLTLYPDFTALVGAVPATLRLVLSC